jgi:hypothetical protein
MYRVVYSIYKPPGIVSVIKVRRLEWPQFVAKMIDGRRVDKLPEGKPGGVRKQGNPRLKFLNDVEWDLMIMCVSIWTKINCGRNRICVSCDGSQE